MKKRSLLFFGILLLCGLFYLSGCSSPIVKEKQVFEDIKKADAYCATFDFEYDSMEVIKRMTDKEKKFDNVYVNFKCHNDDFEYSVECVMNYVLYNDGWLFEDYNVINSSYSALTAPTDTDAIDSYYGYMEKVESKETINSNECIFYGTHVAEVTEFCTTTENLMIPFEFTPEDGWKSTGFSITHYTYDWNWDAFLGNWKANWKNQNFTILEIDSKNAKATSDSWGENCITSANLEYVTGTSYGVIDYPDDIPLYTADFIYDRDSWVASSERVYFTTKGIYSSVWKVNGKTEFNYKYTRN